MKLRSCFSLLAALLIFSLAGCSSDNVVNMQSVVADTDVLTTEREVVFHYMGFDSTGSPIVRGRLALRRGDSTGVVGRWELRARVDTNIIGPQQGRGRLVGHLRGGGLHINLNPNYIDNNVVLHGRLHRDHYVGRWEWIGFPGVMNYGTFRAVRADRLPADVE